ncbi:MAG: ATP-binding cassette domain-containing protein [Pseudomonadota bacterium]
MADLGLELRDLSVGVGDATILHDISLRVPPGEAHVLLGPNGSGKSTVLSAIMGLPPFEVTGGDITYDGASLVGRPPDERAAKGLGMAFQRPPELPGVTVRDFAAALGAEEALQREASELDLAAFAERDLNVGFSGGEIKRFEVLKLFLQGPDLLLFDEPESGVDLEHIAAVGAAVTRLLKTPGRDGRQRSALLITHTGVILDHIDADKAHIMAGGRILHSGPPRALFQHIQRNGYVAPAA